MFLHTILMSGEVGRRNLPALISYGDRAAGLHAAEHSILQ
jgi:hypothetical protein